VSFSVLRDKGSVENHIIEIYSSESERVLMQLIRRNKISEKRIMTEKDDQHERHLSAREIQYYGDGSVWKSTDQVDNKNHGQSTVYYPNGRVQALAHYVAGLMHGNYLLMYENGSIWVESNYIDGFEQGQCNVYYKNGKIKKVSNYKLGLLEGDYIEFYQDGTIKIEATYKENMLIGGHYTFFPDGSIKTYTLYKNGEQKSMFLSYHKNGEIKDLYRYDDEKGTLNNKLMFTDKGEIFLWTLFSPKSKGKPILHLRATELREIEM